MRAYAPAYLRDLRHMEARAERAEAAWQEAEHPFDSTDDSLGRLTALTEALREIVAIAEDNGPREGRAYYMSKAARAALSVEQRQT